MHQISDTGPKTIAYHLQCWLAGLTNDAPACACHHSSSLPVTDTLKAHPQGALGGRRKTSSAAIPGAPRKKASTYLRVSALSCLHACRCMSLVRHHGVCFACVSNIRVHVKRFSEPGSYIISHG